MRRNGDAPMGEHLLKELFIRGLYQSNPWQVFSRHIDREIKKLTLSNLIRAELFKQRQEAERKTQQRLQPVLKMPRAHQAHYDEEYGASISVFPVDNYEDSHTSGAFSAKHQNHAQSHSLSDWQLFKLEPSKYSPTGPVSSGQSATAHTVMQSKSKGWLQNLPWRLPGWCTFWHAASHNTNDDCFRA
jgi:hypothetical protein